MSSFLGEILARVFLGGVGKLEVLVALELVPPGTNRRDTDHRALDELYSLAYEELRRLARGILRNNQRAMVTPTTLVNEAWMKLNRSPWVAEASTVHFRNIVGRAMRQVLVDGARRRHAQIRGGGQLAVCFEEGLGVASPVKSVEDLLALDRALAELAKIAPRQAQLVEARFFGGLSWEEIGELLGVSQATVMREWRTARAWLACQMRGGNGDDAGGSVTLVTK